jgi:hypothetical protein
MFKVQYKRAGIAPRPFYIKKTVEAFRLPTVLMLFNVYFAQFLPLASPSIMAHHHQQVRSISV